MTIHDNELTSLENAFKYLILKRVERCEITVFENHRKSLIQNWERKSYVYILNGQKLIDIAKNS